MEGSHALLHSLGIGSVDRSRRERESRAQARASSSSSSSSSTLRLRRCREGAFLPHASLPRASLPRVPALPACAQRRQYPVRSSLRWSKHSAHH